MYMNFFKKFFLPHIFCNFFVINCLLRSWTTSLEEVQDLDTCTPSIWIKVLWADGYSRKGHFINWVSQCVNHCNCGTFSPNCNKIIVNVLDIFWIAHFYLTLETVHQSPKATVITIWKTAVCKWGISKCGILKYSVSQCLNFRGCI